MKNHQAIIAFGGNLGDVLESFHYALERLETVAKIAKKSELYQTAPVGGPLGQQDYLNAVVEAHTQLSPQDLLAFLLTIEAERGRIRREKWGPRTLDLDLLDYAGQQIEEPSLSLPHPRMWERAFVLIPLHDIKPDYLHPYANQTVKDRLPTIDQVGVLKANLSWRASKSSPARIFPAKVQRKSA